MSDLSFSIGEPRRAKGWPVTVAAEFARDIGAVVAVGGGTVVLRATAATDPNYAPRVVVEKDPSIRDALASAEVAGFNVDVEVSVLEARVKLSRIPGSPQRVINDVS